MTEKEIKTMPHVLAIRKVVAKKVVKELPVTVQVPENWSDIASDESLVATSYKFRIIRANDIGRTMINSSDYDKKLVTDNDITQAVQKKFSESYKYEFRTKGQAKDPVEKTLDFFEKLTPEQQKMFKDMVNK